MTQVSHTERLSALLRSACERKAKQENKYSKKGTLKPYTAHRIGRDANIDTAYAYRVLKGQSFPSRDILIRICKALDCPPDEVAAIFAEAPDYRFPDPEELEDESRNIDTAA
jgi:transcriptional regulator with XRE-family HTH domain